jgi:long-chain fatty acid transport protein
MTSFIPRTALSIALFAAGHAHAGGLWLNEYGDYSGGRASAGAAAGTGDAGGIIHNPAAVTGVQSGQLFLGAGYLAPSAKFDITRSNPILGSDDGGEAGNGTPGAAFAYVNDFGSDRLSFGISAAGLAGAGLDYGREWVGRYQVTEVNIVLVAMQFSVGYEVTDKLSIGVGPQLYYSELDMELSLPPLLNPGGPSAEAKLDGDDNGFGFQAGFIYEAADDIRVGVSYQSELDIEYGGGLEILGSVDQSTLAQSSSDTELTMAQLVRVGLHYDITNNFGIDLTWGWDDWSAMDNVFVSIDAIGGSASLTKAWEDTYHYAAGFQYKLTQDWDITAGLSYDTDPVSSEDRTADLPVDRQIRYNAGARFRHSDDLTFGGYMNYTDLGKAPIEARGFSGDYATNEMWSVSVFVNWDL